MWYIVGLGNPGEKYTATRHNVGWAVLDALRASQGCSAPFVSREYSGQVSTGVVGSTEVVILYPETFMNNSGAAVKKLVPKADVAQLIVVHDDIDLPFGEVKVVVGRGAGGNNGVKSIIDALGTNEFVRVRVGIAPKSFWSGEVKRPKGGGPLERFVLKPFTGAEQKQLKEVLENAVAATTTIIEHGVTTAMNMYN